MPQNCDLMFQAFQHRDEFQYELPLSRFLENAAFTVFVQLLSPQYRYGIQIHQIRIQLIQQMCRLFCRFFTFFSARQTAQKNQPIINPASSNFLQPDRTSADVYPLFTYASASSSPVSKAYNQIFESNTFSAVSSLPHSFV